MPNEEYHRPPSPLRPANDGDWSWQLYNRRGVRHQIRHLFAIPLSTSCFVDLPSSSFFEIAEYLESNQRERESYKFETGNYRFRIIDNNKKKSDNPHRCVLFKKGRKEAGWLDSSKQLRAREGRIPDKRSVPTETCTDPGRSSGGRNLMVTFTNRTAGSKLFDCPSRVAEALSPGRSCPRAS